MITITFASLELSPTVTRYTVIDGGFPLDYDGNTYLNDGLVVELDKTVISAELANVTQNITLFLDNDVKAAIQTDTYRNRRAKIFKGEWDASTSTLSEVRCIYEGIIDTHNTPNADGTIEFIVASLIAPLRRPSDNISLQVLHNQRIEDGVYGAANAIGPTVDTFLRNAGSSFQDFTLGASEYREAVTKPMYIKQPKNLFGNHKRKYVGEETVSAEIQETPGSQLENPASYQPARVYGVSGVNAAIVAAWNHKATGNFTKTRQHYGIDWRGFEDEEARNAIRPDTRFGTIVYLVHAGEIENLNIYIDGLNGDIQSRTLSLQSNVAGKYYLKDEYKDKNGNTRNSKYAAVEVLWGSNSQEPLPSWLDTSTDEIDVDFRGIGYVLVGITFEATRDGAVAKGIPGVGFQVIQTKSVSLDIPAWSETTIASDTGYSYDNTSPYSTNSFYVEGFGNWFGGSKVIPLATGQTFRSAFAGLFLKITPSSAFAANFDLTYGLSSSKTAVYNFDAGVSDIQISQGNNGSNYGKFKVQTVIRNEAGTEYSVWLAGNKGHLGTIDLTQNFEFLLEDTTRTGTITALPTRVANQHPARVIVDYLMDKQVGPGLSADDIDLESFLLCQENAPVIPQYINGVMQGKDTFVEYLQDIADTANLTLYQAGDKIRCRFRKPIQASDVVVTFTENNSSDMSLINFRNEDKFNEFILTVDQQRISDTKAPRATAFPVEVRDKADPNDPNDTSYLQRDNGIRSIGELTSDWLTLFYIETTDANGDTTITADESDVSSEYLEKYTQYARFLMDISRFYEEIELTTTYSIAKDFTIGTVFDVVNDLYGFTGNNVRRYEVVDYADNHNGTISLVGQRHSNGIFSSIEDDFPGITDNDFSNNVFDTAEPAVIPYTANSESAIPSAPSLTAVWEPNSRRIDLSWTEPSINNFNTTHYQVQEQANGETDWTTISEQLVTSDRVFSRAIVERGGIYKYRVIALTPPGMVNGPFSTEKYVRLDLAFGDNKPEQQKIIITGNRSNASVPSTVDTTVTLGLPTNFEAAPVNASGTGATSNLGNLGVDLDVTSDFISATSDSASGSTTAPTTNLPGTPSGGTYSVVDTFQAALTGSTSATDAAATTGTFNLSNGAGSIAITSDFVPASTERFPSSGTVTTTGTNNLPNSAGSVTVTSDFVAGISSSQTGNTAGVFALPNSAGILVVSSNYVSPASGAAITDIRIAGTYSQTGRSDTQVTYSSGTYSFTGGVVDTADGFSGNAVSIISVSTSAWSNWRGDNSNTWTISIGRDIYWDGARVNNALDYDTTSTLYTSGDYQYERGTVWATTQDPNGKIIFYTNSYRIRRRLIGYDYVDIPATSRVESGGTSYTLSRTTGFDAGNGLLVDGISRTDTYPSSGTLSEPVKSWEVDIQTVDSGSTIYTLNRLGNFTLGDGLVVGGSVIEEDEFDEVAAVKNYYAEVSKPNVGNTVYTFNPDTNFTDNRVFEVGSISRTSPHQESGSPRSYSVSATQPASGNTTYNLIRATNFTGGQGWTIGGTAESLDTVTRSASAEAWSIAVSRPESGGTTYELAGGPANLGIDLTVDTQVLTEGSRSYTFPDAGTNRSWSAVFDSTTFSFEVDPNDAVYGGAGFKIDNQAITKGADEDDALTEIANKVISLTHEANQQALPNTAQGNTAATNVVVNLDEGGQATVNYTITVTGTGPYDITATINSVTLNTDATNATYVKNGTGAFWEINNSDTYSITGSATSTFIAGIKLDLEYTPFTWDSTISTNGTTGNREVTIDLGTTSNIGFDISLGGKNSKNPNITDIETLGAGVDFSSYTLTSPDGGSALNFNGFTIDATVADRNTVINEAVRQVDVNAEAPKDFLATSDGNALIFTARTTGTSAGQWNFAWNHGSSTGNLRAKQYETDSDSSSSADNVDAEVVREGVADGTVNNASFPSGTYSSTYTDAVRDERNFFAEKAVIYSEGDTEPAVSITTNDYTWREVLSSG